MLRRRRIGRGRVGIVAISAKLLVLRLRALTRRRAATRIGAIAGVLAGIAMHRARQKRRST